MKLRFFLFCFLFCFFSVFSQDTALALPQITPTSPEAASLGRFGNVPINPATGQMSFTVPIHTIGVDGNSWPIALQYNYGGFILEGKPSLVGLGWNLNAYGTITKQVRGLPDGHPDGYYGVNNVKDKIDTFVANPSSANMDISIYDFMDFLNGKLDSEVDKYVVNIGGTSFSFKLREVAGVGVAYFLSKHNFKVDITMDGASDFEVASFIVTDDSGIKYYFNSNHRERVYVEPAGTTIYTQDKTTAWVLSRIEYLNGQDIVFNYQSEIYNSWSFSASGVSWEGDFIIDGSVGSGIVNHIDGYNDGMYYTEMERQVLTSITFPKGEILINTQPIGNHKVINNFKLKDNFGILVNDFDLTYTGNRDALTLIQKNNEHYYGFNYYGLGSGNDLPGFFESYINKPLDQDYWKFYNGAGNDKAISIGPTIIANKEPSFLHTLKGAMKQIIYPTGGYSEVSYSQNQVKKLYLESSSSETTNFNRQVHLTLEPKLSNTERHTSTTITFDYPVKAQLYHKLIGNMALGNNIVLSIDKLSGDLDSDYNMGCYSNTPITNSYYPYVIADSRNKLIINPDDECPWDPLPILSLYFNLEKDPSNGCPLGLDDDLWQCVDDTTIDHYGDSGGQFWIVPGTYKFTITTRTVEDNPATSFFAFEPLFAEIMLQYYEPPIPDGTDVSEYYVNHNIGGIRVSNIKNFPLQGNSITTHFDYNGDDGLSTAYENQLPNIKDELELYQYLGTDVDYRTESYYLLNSFGSLNAANGVPVYYTRVKQYEKVNNDFIPLDSGTIITDSAISSDLNPDGSSIMSSLSPFGTWPPFIEEGDTGETGTVVISYPEGYTIYEYSPPAEDINYIYPNYPRNIDKTGARKTNDEKYRDDNTRVSSSSNSYNEVRWDLDPTGTQQDNNDDHPWSFKLKLSKIRHVDFNLHSYDNPFPSIPSEIIALKDLHTFVKYREVEKYFTVSQTDVSNQGIQTTSTFSRDSGSKYYLREQTVTSSTGLEIKTDFEYPFDLTSETQYQNMVNKNQISSAVTTKSYNDSNLTSTQKTDYILNINGYKPNKIYAAKGSGTLEERIVIDSYDGQGNIKEMHKSGDQIISFLYGYDFNYPVAKIVGATYSEAVSALPSSAIYLGNFQDMDGTALIDALNELRDNLPDALITTYSYKPLVGVTSITDPRKNTIYYEYDTLNRLKLIKDKDQNVIEQYQYNYKNN